MRDNSIDFCVVVDIVHINVMIHSNQWVRLECFQGKLRGGCPQGTCVEYSRISLEHVLDDTDNGGFTTTWFTVESKKLLDCFCFTGYYSSNGPLDFIDLVRTI